ncbi:MAG: polyprenyl synthetase family protein [Actinomycetes bacterium]
MTAPPLDRADLHARVQKALDSFLDEHRATLIGVSADLDVFLDVLRALVKGGKRLRPAFCYWGWRGAQGNDEDTVVTAATSLELLHACAIIHDDVMDASDTRRGQPSVHRRFASLHDEWHARGSATGFGAAAAILLGDLCLAWADEMFTSSGLPAEALRRARPAYNQMRTELMAGQYLDVLEQARGGGSIDNAMRVVRYKSAKYTIERPLHIGGQLAGAPPAVLDAYTAYGLPLGEAFQLRDDLLGVYGDPHETGKPAGDDLREGKRTVLVAMAYERADDGQRAALDEHLGDPDLDAESIALLRAVIRSTGAVGEVERRITALTEQALAALDDAPLDSDAAAVLRELAAAATARRE